MVSADSLILRQSSAMFDYSPRTLPVIMAWKRISCISARSAQGTLRTWSSPGCRKCHPPACPPAAVRCSMRCGSEAPYYTNISCAGTAVYVWPEEPRTDPHTAPAAARPIEARADDLRLSLTFLLSPCAASRSISSKLFTPVSRRHSPANVPPPSADPLTRSARVAEDTCRTATVAASQCGDAKAFESCERIEAVVAGSRGRTVAICGVQFQIGCAPLRC